MYTVHVCMYAHRTLFSFTMYIHVREEFDCDIIFTDEAVRIPIYACVCVCM